MRSPPSRALASSYLRQLLPMLDGLSFVQRYAWFTDYCAGPPECPDSALFDRTGSVTWLGTIYSPQS